MARGIVKRLFTVFTKKGFGVVAGLFDFVKTLSSYFFNVPLFRRYFLYYSNINMVIFTKH